jgi:hypothetical protein
MDNLGAIVNLVFHLFMIFTIIMSWVALFSLLRFGQSRIIGMVTIIFYIILLSLLYFQALSIINQL